MIPMTQKHSLSIKAVLIPSNRFQISGSTIQYHMISGRNFSKPIHKYLRLFHEMLVTQASGEGHKLNDLSLVQFKQVYDYPGIIGERFIRLFDEEDAEIISVKKYTKVMSKLIKGSLRDKIDLVFRLFDFDNDGSISKEDIRTLLLHIPTEFQDAAYNQKQSQLTKKSNYLEYEQYKSNIDKLLKINFKSDFITFRQFEQSICNISSDIFVAVFSLLSSKFPTLTEISLGSGAFMSLREYMLEDKVIVLPFYNLLGKMNPIREIVYSSQCIDAIYAKKEEDVELNTDDTVNSLPTVSLNPNNIKEKDKISECHFATPPCYSRILARKRSQASLKSIFYQKTLASNDSKVSQFKHFISEREIDANHITLNIEFQGTDIINKWGVETNVIIGNGFNQNFDKVVKALFVAFEYKLYKITAEQTKVYLLSSFQKDYSLECIKIDQKEYYPLALNLVTKSTIKILLPSQGECDDWLKQIRKIACPDDIWSTYQSIAKSHILGKGSFGTVIKAINRYDGSIVAIKIIDKLAKNFNVSLIRSEINIMKLCYHPNIIRYIKHYESETTIYIVMEYLNGDCLNAILAQNFVNESQLTAILVQILKGLKYIHEMGIIHRDIKLENIIFENDSYDSEIKIVDFGLSSLKGPYQDANECYGTLNYIAPEMIEHLPYDNAVDLWSLGIIMYALIEKSFPFDGTNRKEVYT